jgi:hypothetical protein
MDDDKAARAASAAVAAKRQIDGAIAELAASPGHVPTANRMRSVLAGAQLRRARRALTQLPPVRAGELTVVPPVDEDQETEQAEEEDALGDPTSALGGAA